MTIDALKDKIADYARDIRLNLGTVLTVEGAPDLTANQIAGIALSSAYAAKNPTLIAGIEAEFAGTLSDAEREAAKSAASLMAMNNIYYRFVHLVSDKDYAALPARLRMNVIGKPGIPKVDFELYSLAVSAINGCAMCVDAHVHEVTKSGITKIGVQSTIRIAAVINATAQALFIG
ncbi:MAG: carboxymuconolactone decarboxylase family protein [Beijerinckiaceae bacterium]|nr:carboxymuconolactone decarboxylase family protein [Beijerinckiaceae bacterium]